MKSQDKIGFGLVAGALVAVAIDWYPKDGIVYETISSFWEDFSGYVIAIGAVIVGFAIYKFWKSEENDKKLKEKIGENYDGAVERCRICRFLFLLLSLAVFLLLPGMTIWKFLSIVTEVPNLVFVPIMLAGAMAGGVIFSKFLPNYIVSVPQIQGFVTINKLYALLGVPGVTDVVYGPGWHISYPWEDRSEKSNFSLEVVTLEWNEDVPGKDTQLKVTGSYQFEAAVSRGAHYIGIDENTIKTGALDIIKAKVSQDLAELEGNEAKNRIKEENDVLMEEFGVSNEEGKEKSTQVQSFEKRYGIRSVAVTISGIDLPDKVQETRDAVDEARQVINGVAAMYGMKPNELTKKIADETISIERYHEMLDRFATKSGNANMDIKALKFAGLDGIGSVLAGLIGGKSEN